MSSSNSSNMDIAHPEPILAPDIHIVKCVVVGDTGVGKTRLVCNRACGTQYHLRQLIGTHVSTVWAIDHYRRNKEVLEKSWCKVDGVNVSLQLWDTFGYHDKNRSFAYGRADVIVICYSAVNRRSLRSIVNHWYPEVKKECPGVPMIVCACQIDMRHHFMDRDFIAMDKGPFFREITPSDIIPPQEGRAIAQSIGADYYETSVWVPFGIDDLFTNVIRSALKSRRNKHIINILRNLKHVRKPQCQIPYKPPKPLPPPVDAPPPQLSRDLKQLLEMQSFCDVIFVVQGVCMQAHKICLAAASSIFEDLFLSDYTDVLGKESLSKNGTNSTCSGCVPKAQLSKPNSGSLKKKQTDTAKLLDNEEVETSSIETLNTGVSDVKSSLPYQLLNHSAFYSIQLQHCDDIYNPGSKILQTVVTLNDNISPAAFQYILSYLYTGDCPLVCDIAMDVRRAAELMGLKELVLVMTSLINNEDFMMVDFQNKFHHRRSSRIAEIGIKQGCFSDVLFQVDDGTVAAHRALLMSCCDVMQGMFSYNFKESCAKVIPFPGTSRSTFSALQEYLYTGEIPSLNDIDCLELIALANRLCLQRLIAIAEQHIIQEFVLMEEEGQDIMEIVFNLMEPAQMHNASQLAAWCLWFLSVNYTSLYRKFSKTLRSPRPENQIYINKHRWPPVWYLTEVEHYERCLIELEREKLGRTPRYSVRRGSDDDDESGCLGFCSRSRRKLKYDPPPSTTVAM